MIREYTLSDIKEIYNLMCELENKILDFDTFNTIYEHQFNNPNMIGLVYEYNNKVVAFLNMRFELQLHHCEKIAEVMEFIVTDGNRSLGIGHEMFNKASEVAKNNNCAQIELATNQLRERAHRFYEKQGMSNFHYKFSMRLDHQVFTTNKIGN